MRKTVFGILIFLVASVAAYHATIFVTPYVILLKVKLGSHSQFNQPVYANVITAKDRQVVLPNPDFLYVVSGYNIRKAPIMITGMMPEGTYSSIAFYSSNTLNYYIRNDRQTPDRKINILLVKKGDEKEYAGTGMEVVPSPSSLGTMMVRILIDDTSRMEELKTTQRSFKMEAWKD